MKKKGLVVGLLLSATILTSAFTPISINADQGPVVRFEGQPITFSQQPRLIDGILMASVRDLAMALGMEVTWSEAERLAVVTGSGYELKLPMNSDFAYVNGKASTIYGNTQMVNGSMYVPLRFFMESSNHVVRWDSATSSVNVTKQADSLPVVGTYDHLVTLLTQNEGNGSAQVSLITKQAKAETTSGNASVPAGASAAVAVQDSARAAAPGYSGTNVQVEGVDESDVVKTDGTYIYTVNKQRIVVTQAYPADQMKVLSILDFPGNQDTQFQPSEIYVDDKHLIVIGNSYQNYKPVPYNGAGGTTQKKMIMPMRSQGTAKVMVYDLTDRSSLKLVKEAELEGNYVSSRKIGSSLYFISNKYVNYYQYREMTDKEEAKTGLAPAFRDTSAGDSFTSIPLDQVYYLPKAIEPNYVLIGGINLNELNQTMNVTSYLGSGQNVYASEENLYVAVTNYEQMRIQPMRMPAGDAAQGIRVGEPNRASQPFELPKQETIIYQFGLNAGKAAYKHTGMVPGRLLNQFSMDEHNGYFRLATTTGEVGRPDEGTSKNHVFILDANLKEKGKIENIAPGERIYSTRFMGDRAYMVTFKNTDPLFVMDLQDPAKPKLLGALKIPGYSDYLHPYDENHIIGFGKDTIEVDNKNPNGPQSIAYYQGMKVALFDVTDVNHPLEQFKELIGDRGTDSELLHNHRALLFNKEKNLLSFPVNVMKIDPNQATTNPKMLASAYGNFAFQGAYVYSLDLEKGFQFRGGITHLSQDDLQKAGQYVHAGDKQVQRVLYIGDTLYTVSNGLIKANDLSTLKEKNSVVIP
ncbi:beta-propeller domain-containing protein [Paenibacillus alginolyticus]|uniref:Beta-propeller domain-containing protein n=1 Tax=Paenibacillus alginolyticus TaxID=59839 RepID=A0ABT4G5Z6_9BACL|nr:beta-propeller domain-containing protein [Paenibacillus alginolyticus]MCY9691604.1 beta-propeller domain-containing protein [Paenibacillus alginolyticus]MEC0146960.1 beta-propeller domain-containing protein [Paenibacillus alginolyticus]